MSIDQLDARLITLLSEEPGVSVVECARRLGIARATAQGRLDRMRQRGVISSHAPHIEPAALGYSLRIICTIQIKQLVGHTQVAAGLSHIPEIVELHTMIGTADMVAMIVSKSTQDMQRVLDLIPLVEGVERFSSQLVPETHWRERTLPLLDGVIAE